MSDVTAGALTESPMLAEAPGQTSTRPAAPVDPRQFQLLVASLSLEEVCGVTHVIKKGRV